MKFCGYSVPHYGVLVLELNMSNKPAFEDTNIHKRFEAVIINFYDTVVSNFQFMSSFERSHFYLATTSAR